MIKTFNEFTIGNTVYQERNDVGLVEFLVSARNSDFVTLIVQAPDSEILQNSKLTPRELQILINCNCYFFKSIEEAENYKLKQNDEALDRYIRQYSRNIPRFVNQMLEIAYHATNDSTTGNKLQAQAIKHVIKTHFSDIHL